MKTKETNYKIIINKEPVEVKNQYRFQYYSSQINMSISNNCGTIQFTRKVNVSIEDFTKTKFFTESMKRFIFAYLINYNSFVDIKNCIIMVDGDTASVVYTYFKMFEIIPSLSIPASLTSSAIMEPILKKYGTSNERLSSLNNFVIALYKENPTEKFIYIWMAFNGLYGYKYKTNNPKSKPNDNEALKLWGNSYGFAIDKFFASDISKAEHKKIANEVKNLICKDLKYNYSTIKDYESSKLNFEVIEILKKEYKLSELKSSFGYIILKFAYYTRCDLMHGTKKIQLFSDKNNNDYLQFLNNLFIEYLTQVYAYIFNDDK